MSNDDIAEILIERIQNGKINPVTSLPFRVDDIKIDEIRTAVNEKLQNTQTA